MTSKQLAELLLKHPDKEVAIQDQDNDYISIEEEDVALSDDEKGRVMVYYHSEKEGPTHERKVKDFDQVLVIKGW